MSRDISAALASALDNDVLKPFFAVEMLFDGNKVLRIWTGIGVLSYQNNDWAGVGSLLKMSTIQETSDLSINGVSLTLSGVPASILSLALGEEYQGRICNIFFGVKIDSTSPLLFDVPILTNIFSGYMDQMNISEDVETSTIQLEVENKLLDLERPRIARFTSAYQKSIFPNDKGLDYVESLQDKDVIWGRSAG